MLFVLMLSFTHATVNITNGNVASYWLNDTYYNNSGDILNSASINHSFYTQNAENTMASTLSSAVARGYNISVVLGVYLYNVTKHASSNPTTASLNRSGVLIENATFVGNTATFTGTNLLQSGDKITAHSNGASFTVYYDGTPSYPYANTYANFTGTLTGATSAAEVITNVGVLTGNINTYNGTGFGKTFYHGTVSGATLSNSSPINATKYGSYYNFDGINDIITTRLHFENSFTETFWFYKTESTGDLVQERISAGSGANGVVLDSNRLIIGINNGSNQYSYCGGTLSDNTWYHVGATYNYANGNLTLYLDGVLRCSSLFPNKVVPSQNISMSSATNYFNGSIDEVKIWNRSLSQTEIQQEMQSNAVANPQGIVAYYGFSQPASNSTFTPDQNHLSPSYAQGLSGSSAGYNLLGKAINFDGVNDIIVTPLTMNYSRNLTLSAWWNSNKLFGQPSTTILGDTFGIWNFMLYIAPNNGIGIEYKNSTGGATYSTVCIPGTGWQYTTITLNTTHYTIYNNGVACNTGAFLWGGSNTSNLTIGARGTSGSPSDSFNGSIADVRIFNRALNAEEVSTLYYGNQDITFYVQDKVTGEYLSDFTLQSEYDSTYTATNSTILTLPVDNVTVNFSKTTYYSQSNTYQINGTNNANIAIQAYNANATFTLNITSFSANINNYAFTISNTEYGFVETKYTNNTWIQFNLSQNLSYNLTVSGTNLTTTIYQLSNNITSSMPNISLPIYSVNSIYFTIYDEQTNSILNSTTVYLDIIGSFSSGNYSTNNGTLYRDLFTPDTYQLRYYASGYAQRIGSYTLNNDSTAQILLYLAPSANLTNILGRVIDENGEAVAGALVKVLKYSVLSNSFFQVQQLTTDVQGEILVPLYFNSEYYKFIIEYPQGTNKLTTAPSYIYNTEIEFQITLNDDTVPLTNNYIDVSGNVYWNNMTETFSYTWSKGDGTSINSCLYVYEMSADGSSEVINSTCATGASGTIYAGISPYYNSTTYFGIGTANFTTSSNTYNFIVDKEVVKKIVQTLNDNSTGFILLFLAVVAIAFITALSPTLAIILSPFVVLLFVLFGLIQGVVSISAAILLVIVGLFIGFMLNRRST
jgi:hypothetical protein